MFSAFNPTLVRCTSPNRASGDAAVTVLSPRDFSDAVAEITAWDGYAPTPLYSLAGLAHSLGLADLLYKDEGPRFGLGSFKALGGAYAAGRVLQRELETRTGTPVSLDDIRDGRHRDAAAQITLVSATDGNHGRSLAWGAQRYGAACRIYIHRDVSPHREAAIAAFGATVVRIDGDYDESVRRAREDAEQNGWFVVSDTSWEGYSEPPRDVMAGYGVIAHEVAADHPAAPTHVFVQGGVGGLAAAVAASMKQHWGDDSPRVVIVEPELADCLYNSAEAGRLSPVIIEEETMMAGLSCGEPSPLAWSILREEASHFLTIPESFVAPAMRLAAYPNEGDPAIVAGECSAAGLSALIAVMQSATLRDELALTPASVPLLIGTEGASDPEIYRRLVEG